MKSTLSKACKKSIRIGAAAAATVMAFSFASAAAAESLSAKEQSIIPIAAFTAQGDTARLKGALEAGLKNGMTVNEIKDVLVQMYAYTGFPRSLTGLGVMVNLLRERREAGIEDVMGRGPTPLPPGTNILELGTRTQTEVAGRVVAGPVYDFAPEMNTYLREHLFGDIFASDVLTREEREIATISALASLPAPAQLRGHLNCSLNVGVTPEELHEYVALLRTQVGEKEAALAEKTLGEVLAARSGSSK